MLIINFPSNPTAQCVELPFFEKIVALAREHGIWVVHDLAYADITFDGWKAPSIMQVPGARDVAVEFFTMSKSYNMAGWRIGFMVGNKDLVAALARIKGYHDYGTFTPIQVAAIAALEGPQDCVAEIAMKYQKRRDVLVKGLHEAGWMVDNPEGVDVRLGEDSRAVIAPAGSLEFTKKLLAKAKVSVSPGIGFGEYGDEYVRFAMIENENRTRQAVRGIKQMFREDEGRWLAMKPLQVGPARARHRRARHVEGAAAERGGDRAPRRPADPHHVDRRACARPRARAHARRHRRQSDRRRRPSCSRIRTSTSSSS